MCLYEMKGGDVWVKCNVCVRRLGARSDPSADARCPLPIIGKEHRYSKRSVIRHGMGSEKEYIWSPVMDTI